MFAIRRSAALTLTALTFAAPACGDDEGDAIPLEARVLAVADSYEAMTSDRVYRPGMPQGAAIEELERCAGSQFDERIVRAFIATLAFAAER